MARRNPPKHSSKADPVQLAAAVRRKLDAGQTQSALQDAKELVRQHADASTDALLLDAYRARIEALTAQGMTREAADLAAIVRQRFPAAARELAGMGEVIQARRGDFSALLAEHVRDDTPAARRAEIDDVLRRTVIDPAHIATHPALPDDHPLRRAAAAAACAFAEAAAGCLSDAARDGLRVIARRSPMVMWRHLAIALDAFHRQDDAAALAALQHITADASVAPAAGWLRNLLDGASQPDDPRPLARDLFHRIRDGAADAHAQAIALGDALKRRHPAAAGVARKLLEHLHRRDRTLAQRLAIWLLEDRESIPQDLFLSLCGVVQRFYPQAEASRMIAIAGGAGGASIGFYVDWSSFLEDRLQARPALPPLELALLLEHLATLLGPLEDSHLRHLRRVGRKYKAGDDTPWMPSEPKSDLPDPGEFLDYVMKEARRKQREILRTQFGIEVPLAGVCEGLLRAAIKLDPQPGLYRRLLERLPKTPLAAREQLLEAWAASHPTAAEPLVLLAEAAESRKGYQKARAFLARAIERDALDERARRALLRIDIASLLRNLGKNRLAKAAADLTAVTARPEAGQAALHLLLAAIGQRIAEGRGDAAAADTARAAIATQYPALAAVLPRALRQVVHAAITGEFPVEIVSDTTEVYWRVAGLCAAVARHASHDWVALLELDPAATVADIPALPEPQLDLLCEVADAAGDSELVALLAARGLLVQGLLTPVFLAWHAVSQLTAGYGAIDHGAIDDQLRAASELAGRSGNPDIVNRVAEVWQKFDITLDDLHDFDRDGDGDERATFDAQQILRDLRLALQAPPAATAPKRRRKTPRVPDPPPAPPRRQRSLFDPEPAADEERPDDP